MRPLLATLVTLALCGCPPQDPPAAAPTPQPNPAGDSPFAGVSRTEIKTAFAAIAKAAEAYRAEQRGWPKDVQALVDGEYLRPQAAQDPWGRPYVIEGAGPKVIVRTYGADGQPGGAEADTDWDSETAQLGD